MNKFEEAAKKKAVEKREARNKMRDEAQKFVDEFKKEYGNKGFISLRIRDGYIGKELGGGRLQLTRGRPRGTLVAIKGEDGQVFVGHTYLSNKDDDIPIVGIAEALKDAIKAKEVLNEMSEDIKEEKFPLRSLKYTSQLKALKNKNDLELASFFEIRAKCYFYPEIYSHNRGTNKLLYPNYEKVHELRKRALTFIGREDLI